MVEPAERTCRKGGIWTMKERLKLQNMGEGEIRTF